MSCVCVCIGRWYGDHWPVQWWVVTNLLDGVNNRYYLFTFIIQYYLSKTLILIFNAFWCSSMTFEKKTVLYFFHMTIWNKNYNNNDYKFTVFRTFDYYITMLYILLYITRAVLRDYVWRSQHKYHFPSSVYAFFYK